jgi:outer membrane protein assembly factor BamB
MINTARHQADADGVIEKIRLQSFNPLWQQCISGYLEQEETRVNSLVIGQVGSLENRVYVASNANKILIFSIDGAFIDSIEFDEGVEVIKLQIIDMDSQRKGLELLVYNSNDTILFYNVNHKGDYQKLPYQIFYATSTITSLCSVSVEDAESMVFLGNANGDVMFYTCDSLKKGKEPGCFISGTEKLEGEAVTAIAGSATLINGDFGMIAGYRNGLLLLLDKDAKVVSRYDIDKEIELICLVEKTGAVIVGTDDYYIYHFSVEGGVLVYKWNYCTGNAVTALLPDYSAGSQVECYVLSEDSGTISAFSGEGELIFQGDPSFEGTTGDFFQQKMILASREGEIALFEIVEQSAIEKWKKAIYEDYAGICRAKKGNDFYEFFNTEFESDERALYFREFLVDYLNKEADPLFTQKIIEIFALKKYTKGAGGLIGRIAASGRLMENFKNKFAGTDVETEFGEYYLMIENSFQDTNIVKQAEHVLKKDPLKYIDLMSGIRINKLDKIWVEKLFEDDDVVGIAHYHNPQDLNGFQVLIATRKGHLYLLDRHTGQVIWSIQLNVSEGQITNIEVSDICNDDYLEIIIGLENAQNSILILCTEQDKFNSATGEINMNWAPGYDNHNIFKLFITRCRVTGIDFNAIHKVTCFDFDDNGIQDLLISSENGKFDIFYFDHKRDRIIPRTKTVEYTDDDILVFKLIRDENNRIVLYTGSAKGNIEKHIYNDSQFERTGQSFVERDARITDIHVTVIAGEKIVLFSSEDNFIYCLSEDLEYKWSFKTRGDVKSIGVTTFDGKDIILAVSDDGYLYALDRKGNKKWDYPFFKPLDKLFVADNELVIADSDGSVHLLHIKNSVEVIAKMDEDLAGVNLDLPELISNPQKNIRVFAVRKLLVAEPGQAYLEKIIPLLNDGLEFEKTVRGETIRLLTAYLLTKAKFSVSLSEALLGTLNDNAREVRLESVKSFFKLIDRHRVNGADIAGYLLKITKDRDIWVKEYFAGALNKISHFSEEMMVAKWKSLLSLLVLNKDEEWVLNEATNSLVNFFIELTSLDACISMLFQLFDIGLEEEVLERISNKFERKLIADNIKNETSIAVAQLFELVYKLDMAAYEQLEVSFDKFKETLRRLSAQENYLKAPAVDTFMDKLGSGIAIAGQISLDEIVAECMVERFAATMPRMPLQPLILHLVEYGRENNIAEKAICLNFVSETIAASDADAKDWFKHERNLYNWVVKGRLNEIVSKTSRLLLDTVYLEAELDNRAIWVSDSGVADVNLNIINNGYKTVEEIHVNVKKSALYDLIENVGDIGELVKSQEKKVYFKLKPKTMGLLDIFIELTYRGCTKSVAREITVELKETALKEWQVIPNPYTSGIPIENDEVFVGRESLIQEAVLALKKDPVFVMGHRRMGKTSLIKYIQRHHLSTPEFIPVFISAEKVVLNNMNEFLFSFCDPIAYELAENEMISEDEADKYMDNIRNNGLIDFNNFFNRMLRKISKLSRTLVLIIDEYPIIHEAVELNKVDGQFISNLRGYMQNNSREFKMIYSGASSLKYLKSQYSSNIMGVGKSIEVSFLSEDDVKKLIDKPLKGLMQFDRSAFEYFMELTNGQPFLVQVILSYLVDKLNREKKSAMVFKDALENGMSYFLDQAPHLQDDWNNRVYSTNLKWDENEERVAKMYKQLIITALTDNWRKSKNGLGTGDLFTFIERGVSGFHKLNKTIFDEVISLLAGGDDVLKEKNNLLFIKVGLFRELALFKMNLSFTKALSEARDILPGNNS